MNVRRYLWQRATAAIMLPLVLLHVAVIFYATRQGMTAADILARCQELARQIAPSLFENK